MLFLGFSAGLPLLLVLGTLSFRLREAGIDRSTIGFLSWWDWSMALNGYGRLWSIGSLYRCSPPYLDDDVVGSYLRNVWSYSV